MSPSWEEVPITELFRLKQGTYLESDEIFEASSDDHPFPVYGANGIIGYSHRKMYDKRTILISCRGANCGVVHFARSNAWVSNNSIACIPRVELDSRFYYYTLLDTSFLDVITGSAQPQITITNLSSKRLSHPPLPTQDKIGAILAAYDELIANNTRRIAILEEMAQLLYREWFVHFRFPGYEDVQMADSELGAIPEGWKVVSLSKVAKINRANLKKRNAPERINYVTIGSVSEGQIEEIKEVPYDEAPSRARRIVQHGDIIWTKVRPNLRSYALILHPVPNMIVSTGFAVITPRRSAYSYLYQAVTTEWFVDYLTKLATGAAYPAVRVKDFKDAKILLPSDGILEAFDSIASDLYVQQHILRKTNKVLRHGRDLLLPRLVSGELDVGDLPIDVTLPEA